GGTDSASYRCSVGITDGQGIVYNTNLRKFIIGGDVDCVLSDKWSVGYNIRYIRSNSDHRSGVEYGETANKVVQLVMGASQVDWSSLRDWRNLTTVNMVDSGDPRMVPINWNTAYNNNPFWALDNNLHPWERNRFMGGANIGYEINDKLRLDMQT